MARAFFAAGFRPGDVALNTFSYHLTPGGWIMDGGLRALGCAVIPSGPGNTEAQLDLIAAFRPAGYVGTPDFLKILLDAAEAAGRDASCIRRALVSGAAFPPSLQAEVKARGVDAYQMYGTADLGCVAYETAAREGLVVAEEVILEIVRPGTGDPVPDGEIGEVVVTVLDEAHPILRLALGDLSAVLPGVSPCGRTNTRILGWRGRADPTATDVRAARAGGRNRATPPRPRTPAPGRDARRRAGRHDAARRGRRRTGPRRCPCRDLAGRDAAARRGGTGAAGVAAE
jgi:phenylacetate-CoA ligase